MVLTCIGLLIIRPLCIKNRYETCMDAVAASTIYAKRHRGVRALVDGQELRLRESNARSMYSTLATLGVGHFTDRLPEGEPDATLYYSDTSVMRLWRYPLPRQQSGRWEGVFISFVTLEGTTYSYYTDRTDWPELLLAPEGGEQRPVGRINIDAKRRRVTGHTAFFYSSCLMERMAFFSNRLTCACEMPISEDTSIWVLP